MEPPVEMVAAMAACVRMGMEYGCVVGLRRDRDFECRIGELVGRRYMELGAKRYMELCDAGEDDELE